MACWPSPTFPVWRHGSMHCSSTSAFSPCRFVASFFWLVMRETSGGATRHGEPWHSRVQERRPWLGSAIDLANEIRRSQGRAASDGQEQSDRAELGSEPFKGGGAKNEPGGGRDYAQGYCRHPHGGKPDSNVNPTRTSGCGPQPAWRVCLPLGKRPAQFLGTSQRYPPNLWVSLWIRSRTTWLDRL